MRRRGTFLLFISLLVGAVLTLLLAFSILVEPSIEITGIENRKVYATPPVIQMEDYLGITLVTLNGKEITPAYRVNENGSYTLEGESTLLWKKKKVSYSFEVDDKPPAEPVIKEGVDQVYFKQAKLTLEEDELATYEVSLNGKEISLKQPIQQPGDHTLTITATKPNGLTATREYSFTIDDRMYSEQEINQFIDFYFTNDVPMVYKFSGDIAIYLDGDYNEEDVKMVESTIEQIKAFFPYEIRIVETLSFIKENRTVRMVFTPTKNFQVYDVHNKDAWGVAMSTRNHTVYGIMESLALIGTNSEITRDYRNAVILHELLHVVGLVNHVSSPQSSSLFPYANKTVVLADLEKKLGELLYLGEIKPNIKKEEAIKLLEQRVAN
ncbi:hypothetical protein [Bacillus sp. MRMR6]|uniref:hypothetical protein n=1 Tax=Bacillus sp. MRMR6 TaxID=1928617 RepID=UPI000950D59D|nr:hypothetical protein [Bacillus sp. MRMR6]OLS33589.1 hypothetical protein BTR25_25180 [Bacillus sp. MRMR6]